MQTQRRRRGPRQPPPPQQAPIPAPVPAPQPSKGGSILGPIGAAVGNFFAPGLGGALGGAAGNLLGGWLGFSKKRVNRMVRSLESSGSIRFPYRELLTELNGSTGFVNQAFALNPGDVNTFPFLSKLAQYFTEYNFESLRAVFVSQSADALNSTNTALGSIHMATNYNALEPAFTSEAQVLVTPGVTCTKPSTDAVHYIDVMPRNGRETLYIRSSAVYGNADARLDDLGLLQISTAGMQAVADIGKVWIEYDVVLRKPRLAEAGSVGAASFAHIRSSAAGASASNPLSSAPVVDSQSTIPVVATATTLTLPYQGYYLITGYWKGSGIAAGPTISVGANITSQNLLANNSVGADGSFTSTISNLISTVYVTVPGTGAGNTCTIGGLTSMSAANADIIITSIPGNYASRKPITEDRFRELFLEMIGQMHDPESPVVCVDYDDVKKLPEPSVLRRR